MMLCEVLPKMVKAGVAHDCGCHEGGMLCHTTASDGSTADDDKKQSKCYLQQAHGCFKPS